MIYLKTVLILLVLLAGWFLVRAIAYRFASQHPEFGTMREEGEGCGCGKKKCSTSKCERETH